MKYWPEELLVAIFFAVVGFVIGGAYGEFSSSGFHPSCWVGAAIGFLIGIGAPFCACLFD